MEAYYDESYFNFQKEQGEFAAKAMFHFFQPYIKETDSVLDFGCGGGFLLNELKAKSKMGIEINETARKYAANTFNLKTAGSIADIDDNWADVIISSHALEHTTSPLSIISDLKPKLKKGGLIVFLVPHETKYKYNAQDVNKHLYTWSEMNLGNLFDAAGYQVKESKEIVHRFPPNHKKILKYFGWKVFHFTCKAYGYWARYRHMTQVRVIAENK